MTRIKYLVAGLLFSTVQPLFADNLLPAPSENTPTPPPTAVEVRPLSYDQKDIKLLDGVRLAENTEASLPEPQAQAHERAFAVDLPEKNNIENTSLAPPMETGTKAKNTVDVYVTGGAGFSNLQTSGTIHGEAHTTTVYNAANTSTNTIYGASTDYTFRKVHGKPVDLALGLGFVGTTPATITGTSVTSHTGIPNFSHPYGYNVSSKAAFFEQRAIYHSEKHPNWQPYLITGVGPSWNTMDGFYGFNGKISDTVFASFGNHFLGGAHTLQPFAPETTSSFAYEAGFGMLHPLSDRFAVTADYRYINFGKAELGGLSLSPDITGRLSTSPISENTLLLSLAASFTT